MNLPIAAAKIFFCGDPHGKFQNVISSVRDHQPAAVVLLGDQQAKRPLQEELAEILALTQVWWISGNHDTDTEQDYDNLFGSTLADRNLQGQVVEVGGVRIAGLGGVFRGKVWDDSHSPSFESPEALMKSGGKGNRWRGGLTLRHRSSIFPSDVNGFKNLRADILVTHEAPSVHSMGSQILTDLATSLQVKASFHGHHHQSTDYADQAEELGLRFHPYGVGLRGVTNGLGEIIVPGEIPGPRDLG